ncbi:hypothetical protein K435DRAFT_498218 [Dendrothele bispora CBS 962.96]|uniref:Uncharacterized protein n=1 Tax=Dendrothele bispora (strain CBS 962.96) TaxID=1314807 RepID=A0A4S8MA47_DENBC|nr:hypothetical protein K435DRAFT_498218 [Dendrothele bispora CBS 962.96]
MSLNDFSMKPQGSDVHPGVANPTSSNNNSDPMAANFVSDPTSEERGAGAGPTFEGDSMAARNFKQTAGVVEGRPGIIESTNIDPLNENSNKDDGWANASTGTKQQSEGITGMVKEQVNKVYETVAGKK